MSDSRYRQCRHHHPAKPNEDISKLHEKGVPVYAVSRGSGGSVESVGGKLLTCVQVIPRKLKSLIFWKSTTKSGTGELMPTASNKSGRGCYCLVSISDSTHATGGEGEAMSQVQHGDTLREWRESSSTGRSIKCYDSTDVAALDSRAHRRGQASFKDVGAWTLQVVRRAVFNYP